jgi:hypothetical protein
MYFEIVGDIADVETLPLALPSERLHVCGSSMAAADGESVRG